MSRKGINLNCPDWRETEFFKTNRVLDCVDEVSAGIDEWLKTLGYERNGFYYEHLEAEESHETVALFSHGGSSCAALAHILNLSFPYSCALFHFEFTGITILRFDRRKGAMTLPCLELANDGKHIKEGYYHRLNEL